MLHKFPKIQTLFAIGHRHVRADRQTDRQRAILVCTTSGPVSALSASAPSLVYSVSLSFKRSINRLRASMLRSGPVRALCTSAPARLHSVSHLVCTPYSSAPYLTACPPVAPLLCVESTSPLLRPRRASSLGYVLCRSVSLRSIFFQVAAWCRLAPPLRVVCALFQICSVHQ